MWPFHLPQSSWPKIIIHFLFIIIPWPSPSFCILSSYWSTNIFTRLLASMHQWKSSAQAPTTTLVNAHLQPSLLSKVTLLLALSTLVDWLPQLKSWVLSMMFVPHVLNLGTPAGSTGRRLRGTESFLGMTRVWLYCGLDKDDDEGRIRRSCKVILIIIVEIIFGVSTSECKIN